MELLSPSYKVSLIEQINEVLWDKYRSYENVEIYMSYWTENPNGREPLFNIQYSNTHNISLKQTLRGIPGEILIKIAIDLGIETPDFLPSIPTFRNELKTSQASASSVFEKAFRNVDENPADAIAFANSALESIIKEILNDSQVPVTLKGNETTYDLCKSILAEFKMFPNDKMPKEIKTIGSSLLSASKAIEDLRSNYTDAHGQTNQNYVIHDSLYAYFIVNAVCTVGKFLMSYYKKVYCKEGKEGENQEEDDYMPF